MGTILYPGVTGSGIQTSNSKKTSYFNIPEGYSNPLLEPQKEPLEVLQEKTRRSRTMTRSYYTLDRYGRLVRRNDYEDSYTTTHRVLKENENPTKNWRYDQTYVGNEYWNMDNISKPINGADIATKLNRQAGFESTTRGLDLHTRFYNRFKLAQPDDAFVKGIPHVFFVRPDCHLIQEDLRTLYSDIAAEPLFNFMWKSSPDIIKQLTIKNGMDHHWMYLLSNKTSQFSLNDETISYGTHGKNFIGYGISYGKHNIESKGPGTISVNFTEDRNLSIYKTHKLWTDYIANMYRGRFIPDSNSVFSKILEYCGAVYYVLTAEDGETILFWSKYYGIFPTTIPSSQYSWSAGQMIGPPEFSATYAYSFKEDFSPISLLEINVNTFGSSIKAKQKTLPRYDPNLLTCGDTWVGAPVVEATNTIDGLRFKLRFLDPYAN